MRKCSRCGWSKPDASFVVGAEAGYERRMHGRCFHCRVIVGMMEMRTVPPKPLKLKEVLPSSAEREAKLLFKKELEEFNKRGAPEVLRTYTRNHAGWPVVRKAFNT